MSVPLLLEVAAAGLLVGGLYAMIAVGLNIQYGLMRVLNVAHGEFIMIGGYLTYLLYARLGINPLITILISGPVMFALGAGIHTLLFRHLLRLRRSREELEANSLLISFGL
ncbi:MAG: ABC transporter permease subunit, partial [Armatimonadota bacterium]